MSGVVEKVLDPFMPDAPKLPKLPPLPELPAAPEPALSRASEAVQAAAQLAGRRRRASRGRSSTILTPLNSPIPSGSIRKTVLGGS